MSFNITTTNYNLTFDGTDTTTTTMTTKIQPTFAFASSPTNVVSGGRGRKGGRHRRSYSEDTDNTDGAGSLTYSATSSVQSGGSAAGESTDSSFADIMRVLDLQDSDQLKEFIKKEGCTSVDELQKKRGWSPGGGASVASSLAYSTDAESHLEGTKLLQTIAGQPSDSYAFDGGGVGDGKMDLLFAPAAPAVVKKTKGNKVVLGKDKTTKSKNNTDNNSINSRSSSSNNNNNRFTTPKSGSGRRKTFDDNMSSGTPEQHRHRHHSSSSPSPTKSTPTKSPPGSSSSSGGLPGTPPLPSRKYFTKDGIILDEDDDVWYKEWWMSCFPDAFKNLMPKR